MWRYPRETRPYFRWLVDVAKALDLNPRVTSTVRSRRKQKALYNKYLAGQSPFPAARPGTSRHERGLAIDLVTNDPALLGQYWQYYVGGKWAGPKDWVHYEL
jgi:hypothetical protein